MALNHVLHLDLSPISFFGLLISTFLLVYLYYYQKMSYVRKLVNKLPGPTIYPLFGNSLTLILNRKNFIKIITNWTETYPDRYRFWAGIKPYIITYNEEDAKIILSSSKHVNKSSDYDFVHDWLGSGLLTSNGNKWRARRKLLVPAFHTQILEGFIDIFNEQSEILLSVLAKEQHKDSIDIYKFVALCSLDCICDTIMGHHVDAQKNCSSDYVKATERIKTIIFSRMMIIWLWPNWIFKISSFGKKQSQLLRHLHGFTEKIIQERKSEVKIRLQDSIEKSVKKKRKAFLDLLLDVSDEGKVLCDQDIREEVDTFTFAGHDTTASSLGWALLSVGTQLESQQKIHKELDDIFDSSDRQATIDDLKQMKYLECVIKETLRYYPPVPFIARHLMEEVILGDYTIPAGVTVGIYLVKLLRNPKVFTNPDQWNPERFLQESTQNSNGYSFIPFSAGPRSCIGQKFALIEEKVILSRILRSYSVKALDTIESIVVVPDIVLKSLNGINVKLSPRKHVQP